MKLDRSHLAERADGEVGEHGVLVEINILATLADLHGKRGAEWVLERVIKAGDIAEERRSGLPGVAGHSAKAIVADEQQVLDLYELVIAEHAA